MPDPTSGGQLDINDLLRQALANLAQAGGPPTVQMPQVTAPPGADTGPPTSLLGRFGEALGGSAAGYIPMTSQQRDAQGYRNLMDFFGGMAARPFGGPGVGIAEGVGRAEQAAQQPLVQTKTLSEMAQQQQQTQLDRVKAATDLLNSQIQLRMLGARLGMPPLYGDKTGTGGPGGGPGGGDGGAPAGTDIYSLPKAQFLPAVAQRESGGNPSILNYVARADPTAYARGATASGKYQIVNSTWQEGMKLAGLNPATYARAMDAPEAVQDKVASALYDKYGTAPWDPSKFGANWVQQPGGGYQLVKGAPYTLPPGRSSTAANQPPAPPPGVSAQPAGKPPAPAGGTNAAALAALPQGETPAHPALPAGTPTPPREPPGAVPTVSTPEQAVRTANAAGTPIQIPGTERWAIPGGGTTSTPNLIMPGTDVAGPGAGTETEQRTLNPPRPGMVTTPGGQVSPAPSTTLPAPPPGAVPPAQQPPAQQPPAQPAPQQPPSSEQPKPTPYQYPGDLKANAEEYMTQHFQPASAQEIKTYAPGPDGDVAAAAADQVRRAQANVRVQQRLLDEIHSGMTPGDVSKQAAEVEKANTELDAAQNKYNDTVRALTSEGAKNLLTRDDAERARVNGNWQKVQDRLQSDAQLAQTLANNIKLKEIEGEQQRLTNKEQVQNKVNQDTLAQASKDQIDARNLGSQVEGFQSIIENIGQPGWLQTTKNPFGQGESIAEKLGQMGWKVDDTGGYQMMQAGINEMIKSLRAGMPMGSLSDRDLDFIRRMGPTDWMDPDTRMAVTSYILQAARAKQQFSYEVQKELGRPNSNAADAIEAADRKVKPFVPTVPADLTAHWSDQSPEWTQRKIDWATEYNVRPGTLFHLSNGDVLIAKRAPQTQIPQTQAPPARPGPYVPRND